MHMADWTKITGRGNVEDRRGSPLALAGGGIGFVGVGIILLFNLLTGTPVDLGSILQQLPPAGNQSAISSQDFEGEDDYEIFSSKVLASNNEVWQTIFAKQNMEYTEPRLVLFRSATQSACGSATSSVGPHYCPLDQTIYIDETFYVELTNKLGAKGGDVAEAYVLAHEVGHHVQYQLGILEISSRRSQDDSIKAELQADCFAGIWANSVSELGVFAQGEITEAIDAAAAVGDDRIQEKVTGQINPETWTHGSSEQRVSSFTTGYNTGSPGACNIEIPN